MHDDTELEGGCLSRLFGTTEAISEHWPERHLVFHGPLARLGALAALPEFARLDSLLGAYRAPVRVALPDKRDEHSSLQVDATAAAAMYGEGLALIFDRVDRFFPLVAQWVEQLRLELALPARCEARSIIYATPAGGGNSPHFDANVNFVVQLRGTKRWRLAPNVHVRHPTDRFAMNQQTASEELEAYVEGPFPTRLPDDAEVIDLVPGSVLFVPRGCWHATEAGGDTLAINFTFSQPTWADGVLLALRKRLLKDDAWRELASGPVSPMLLTELLHEVEALTTGDVFAALDGRPSYQLVEDAFLRVEDGVAMVSLSEEEFELEVDARLHPVLEWLVEQPESFSLEDVTRHFPEISSGLSGLVDLLVAKGVLEGAAR